MGMSTTNHDAARTHNVVRGNRGICTVRALPHAHTSMHAHRQSTHTGYGAKWHTPAFSEYLARDECDDITLCVGQGVGIKQFRFENAGLYMAPDTAGPYSWGHHPSVF